MRANERSLSNGTGDQRLRRVKAIEKALFSYKDSVKMKIWIKKVITANQSFKEGESMDYQEIARHFQTTSFDPQPFVQTAIDDRMVREMLVENVVDGQNHINEYFNSYLIIKEVATKKPELIYDEWERIWALHTHKNSYHRWIAHDLITQLLMIDHEDKFEAIKREYVLLPKEEKISNYKKMSENIQKAMKLKDLSKEISLLWKNKYM